MSIAGLSIMFAFYVHQTIRIVRNLTTTIESTREAAERLSRGEFALRFDGHDAKLLIERNLPTGLFLATTYEEINIRFERGDVLVVYAESTYDRK